MQKGQKRRAVGGANRAELGGTKGPSPAIATPRLRMGAENIRCPQCRVYTWFHWARETPTTNVWTCKDCGHAIEQPKPARYKVRWRYRADSVLATTTCSFDDPRFLVRWMRDFLGPAIVVIDKLWEQPC